MALLVAMLLQRRVRESIAEQGVPLQIPVKVKTLKPTASMILGILDTVRVQRIRADGQTLRFPPERDRPNALSRCLRITGANEMWAPV